MFNIFKTIFFFFFFLVQNMDTAETIIIIALLGAGAYLLYKKYKPIQKPVETTQPTEITTPLPISTVKPTIQYGELKPVGQSTTLTQSQIKQEIQNSIPSPELSKIPRSVSQVHTYTPQIKTGVNINNVPWLKKSIEYTVPPLHVITPKNDETTHSTPAVVSPPTHIISSPKEPIVVSIPKTSITNTQTPSSTQTADPYSCIELGESVKNAWGKPFINYNSVLKQWFSMYYDSHGTGHISPPFNDPHSAYNWLKLHGVNQVIVMTSHGNYYFNGFRC
jgi:hypothetical protein